MPGRGAACPNCRSYKGEDRNGHYVCRGCHTIWWTVYDRPSKGQKGRGYKCFTCFKMTLHEVGQVAGATIFRCSVCASTKVVPAGGAR